MYTPVRLLQDLMSARKTNTSRVAKDMEAKGIASYTSMQPAMQRMLKGSRPTLDTIKNIGEYFNIDPSAFASPAAAEAEAKRQGLIKGAPNIEHVPMGMTPVPLINNIQAGMWTETSASFADEAEETIWTDQKVSKSAFALRIKGKSMYRPDSAESYDEGDIVIIDPNVTPLPGDCVAAKNGAHEATFKKYRPRGLNAAGLEYFELVPLNPDYPTLRSDLEEVQIIGTSVEHRKFRKR